MDLLVCNKEKNPLIFSVLRDFVKWYCSDGHSHG